MGGLEGLMAQDGFESREDLQAWLAPFLERLLYPAQRRMCPLYVTA